MNSDPKATEPEKDAEGKYRRMTLKEFRDEGYGRLFVPASSRRKGVARHKGESMADMMRRLGA